MNKYIILTALCVFLAGSALSSCSKEDTEENSSAPVFVLSTNTVTATSSGGECKFTYNIVNPADDGDVFCVTSDSWILNLDYSVAGTVSFLVAENPGSMRKGTIAVSYYYGDSVIEDEVVIAQDSFITPSLSARPSAVTAPIVGGTCEFYYTVTNPSAEAVVSCDSDSDWVYGFDSSVNGTISFTVDANEVEELRIATITLNYVCSGGTVSEQVLVVQDHTGGELDSFDGTIDDLVGTYEATGMSYYSDTEAREQTWTLKIYPTGSTGVFIDGITPDYTGRYPDTPAYAPVAFLNPAGQMIIHAQFSGYVNTSYNKYIAFPVCVAYTEGSGYQYDGEGGQVTFTYDYKSGTWTSDYGMFVALYRSLGYFSQLYFYGYFDVVVPGYTLKKVSDSTDDPDEDTETLKNVKSEDEAVLHTGAYAQ